MNVEARAGFEDIFKSLMYFFERVLPSTQQEGEWTVESIEQGLGWALYCEKVALEPTFRPTVITFLETYDSGQHFTISQVECSRKMFISNLFMNQLMTEDILYSLMEISCREIGRNETLEIMNNSYEKVKMYRESVTVLRSKPFEETLNIFKVRLVIEAVSTASVPFEVLKELLENEGNLTMILELSNTVPEEEEKRILNCVKDYLMVEVDNGNVSVFNQLSSVSTFQISRICDRFPELITKLTKFIHNFGSHLSSSGVKEYSADPVYKSVVCLCNNFFRLESLRPVIREKFATWLLSKDVQFWHTLLVDAQKEILAK